MNNLQMIKWTLELANQEYSGNLPILNANIRTLQYY